MRDSVIRDYEYAGLRVVSEIEIPEWSVFRRGQNWEDADVSIFLNGAGEPQPVQLVTRDEYEFYIEHVAAYRVCAGREIIVTPSRGAGEREVRLFLLGAAWGALCYQRGILLLHASVVRVGEHALAFCGPSGAGKSSMAAALVARGFSLVTDDLSRVDFSQEKIASLYPSAPRLKLWNDALEQLQTAPNGLERDFYRADKFHVPLPSEVDFAPVVVRALYLLDWGELSIARLHGAEALQRCVQSATYRGDLLEPMGILAEHWERMAELKRRVDAFALRRPRAWENMDTAIDLVLETQKV